MNTKLSGTVLAALIVGGVGFSAVAQPGPGGPGPGPAPQMQKPGPQAPQMHRQPAPPPAATHAAPHPSGPAHMQQRQGAGPDHRWQKGSRVPQQYRTQHYVVKDWQHHGLQRPGRGQQWVQNGNDYLLVAVASGVIAQMVLGR